MRRVLQTGDGTRRPTKSGPNDGDEAERRRSATVENQRFDVETFIKALKAGPGRADPRAHPLTPGSNVIARKLEFFLLRRRMLEATRPTLAAGIPRSGEVAAAPRKTPIRPNRRGPTRPRRDGTIGRARSDPRRLRTPWRGPPRLIPVFGVCWCTSPAASPFKIKGAARKHQNVNKKQKQPSTT